jgi:hypothetical protein
MGLGVGRDPREVGMREVMISDASVAAVAKRTRKVQRDGRNLRGDVSTKIFTNGTLTRHCGAPKS